LLQVALQLKEMGFIKVLPFLQKRGNFEGKRRELWMELAIHLIIDTKHS